MKQAIPSGECSRRSFLTSVAAISIALSMPRSSAMGAAHGASARGESTEPWIGYSVGRNDLPTGQFDNWRTQRARVVKADGTNDRAIGEALIENENSWTQFAGWSPDGAQAIVLSLWEDPLNAAWEREQRTFRMT